MAFWSITLNSLNPPIKIKRIINYIDDTVSPVLRNRNSNDNRNRNSNDDRNKSDENQNNSHLYIQNEENLIETQNSPFSACSEPPTPSQTPKSPFKSAEEKVSECLYSGDVVDLDKLKKLSWTGIPAQYRAICWKILMGYLPPNMDRHESILIRKRREYREITVKYFGEDGPTNGRNTLIELIERAKTRPSLDFNDLILHQISIDIPRTCPELALFQIPRVQGSLLRILYCWSIRRPATGYVQGINDLVTPFYVTFLETFSDPQVMTDEQLAHVEADTFWCLSNLLDTIQDSYTFNQSGIYRQVSLLREISLRMDPQLVKHLESEGVQFIQFAFRWMNCLLLREFRLSTIQRLWDSYLSEGSDGFKSFHPYICAAFLLKWRRELQVLEFQDIIVFLQRPPTENWNERDVELLVAEAFVLKSLFNK